MKKIIVLMIAAFLVFSINGFSQSKTKKTTKGAKTEQVKKTNSKTNVKPRRSKSKRVIQKPRTNRQAKRRTNKGIKV